MYTVNNVADFKYLTKENILDCIDEEDIFIRYYFDLNGAIDLNKNYKSPFRNDSDPSGRFFIGRNKKLLFIDFGENSSVTDCFGFVSKMFNLSFFDTLKKINTDFNLHLGNNIINHEYYNINKYNKKNRIDIKNKFIKEPELLIKKKDFDIYDLAYWNSYFINKDILNKFNVYSVNFVYLDGKIIWKSEKNDPIFCYYFPKEKKKKIYRPLSSNKKYRFLSSNNIGSIIQGYDQLPVEDDILIITKSLKDVMVLYYLGYNSIAPNSESYNISEEVMNELKKRFEKIYVFYDNDSTGIKQGLAIAEQHDIANIYIRPGLDCYSHKVKDISDFIKVYGENVASTLMQKKLNL